MSVHVIWGLRQQNTVFAVGRSIIDRSSTFNIGRLMLSYGGGGHQAAGTCQIDNDRAEPILAEIVTTIDAAERAARYRLIRHDSDLFGLVRELSAVTGLPLTGGCLCGGVRFELTAPPMSAGYCHCTRCQRRTGCAASAQARVDGRAFRLLQGEELVKCWRHPDGGCEKCFCGECGHTCSAATPRPRTAGRPHGRIRHRPRDPPEWRQFVAYAATWEPIPDDGIERFAESSRP